MVLVVAFPIIAIITQIYLWNIVIVLRSVVSRIRVLLINQVLLIFLRLLQLLQCLLSSLLLCRHVIEVRHLIWTFWNWPLILQFLEFPFLLKDIDEQAGNKNKAKKMQPVVDRLFVCEQHLQEILNKHHHLFLLLY